MANLLKRFVSEEEGLELVEYGLLAALLVVALAATYAALSSTVEGALSNATTVFP